MGKGKLKERETGGPVRTKGRKKKERGEGKKIKITTQMARHKKKELN